MTNAVKVSKLIEGALSGDLDRVKSYGALIADQFEQEGETRAALIVRRSLGLAPPGSPAVLDAPARPACPVCGTMESKGCLCSYVRSADGSVKVW